MGCVKPGPYARPSRHFIIIIRLRDALSVADWGRDHALAASDALVLAPSCEKPPRMLLYSFPSSLRPARVGAPRSCGRGRGLRTRSRAVLPEGARHHSYDSSPFYRAFLASERSLLVVRPLWRILDPIRSVLYLPLNPAGLPIGGWKALCLNLARCARLASSPGTHGAFRSVGHDARGWQAWHFRGPWLMLRAARSPRGFCTSCCVGSAAIALTCLVKSIFIMF